MLQQRLVHPQWPLTAHPADVAAASPGWLSIRKDVDMASQPYLVVRLVPEAPIDGATFITYLDGLQLQVFDAFTGTPLSDIVYSSPLSFFQWPLGYSDSSGEFFASPPGGVSRTAGPGSPRP